MVGGKPKVEGEPKVNLWTGAEIQAVLKGAATLEGPWVKMQQRRVRRPRPAKMADIFANGVRSLT